MLEYLKCPQCGHETKRFKSPTPTVDIIIECETNDKKKGIILIYRKNPPLGWAIPGGYVDYGETIEAAAIREAREETSLDVTLIRQFHTYSDPRRDPRFHTIGTVFIAKAKGSPKAGDDAQGAKVIKLSEIEKMEFAFDHKQILKDYLMLCKTKI